MPLRRQSRSATPPSNALAPDNARADQAQERAKSNFAGATVQTADGLLKQLDNQQITASWSSSGCWRC